MQIIYLTASTKLAVYSVYIGAAVGSDMLFYKVGIICNGVDILLDAVSRKSTEGGLAVKLAEFAFVPGATPKKPNSGFIA